MTAQALALAALAFALVSGNVQAREVAPTGARWRCHIIDDSHHGADGVKLADINGDGLMDVATGWEESGVTRIYLHPGHDRVKLKWPAVTVGSTPSVEDAVFADLDADGAMDVISCCEGYTRTIFVHWGPKHPKQLLNPAHWQQTTLAASENRMRWMFARPMQVDGQHGVDLVAGGKNENAQLGWFEAPPTPRDLAKFKWHAITPAGWIMSIWKRDMEGDGDLDLVISDRRGPLRGCRWLENPGPGSAQTGPWRNHFMGARDHEVLSMALSDLDCDGLEDALVAVKDFRIVFLRRLDKRGLKWQPYDISADYHAGNTRAVAVADMNLDTRPDIVSAHFSRPGQPVYLGR